MTLGLMPLPAAAETTVMTGVEALEFILPAPADQDGPAVTAQPVAGVEEQELLAPATPAAREAPVVMAGTDADTAFWRQADASNDAEKVKVYLLTYPQGHHVAAAKVRFRELLSALSARPAPLPQRRPARPARFFDGPPP
ncbi:MAG TPA: hypothetical protein DC046_18430, partial [Rhodospirillaceae bacterium]|nr:hypothetical protein [Rhodospirillaceae bacterium]